MPKDRINAVALLVDTAHGGSSLRAGWLEVMLGRRCDETDSISVNDTDVVDTTSYLLPAATAEDAAVMHRVHATVLSAPLVPQIHQQAAPQALLSGTTPSLRSSRVLSSKPRTPSLPRTLHLLSLDRLAGELTPAQPANRVLVRVQHIMQEGEAPAAAPLHFRLDQLLRPAGIALSDIVELPLNGLGDGVSRDSSDTQVLQPLQILTLAATLTPLQARV